MTLPNLNPVVNRFAKEVAQPGAIFLLPVYYDQPYPTPFVEGRSQGSKPLDPAERVNISTASHWQNCLGHYTNAEDAHRGAREVCSLAKVRPFLVLRRITYQSQTYFIGLPISSIKDYIRNNRGFYQELVHQKIEKFHYLDRAANPHMGLHKESYTLLSTPHLLAKDFFTTFLGYVTSETICRIRERAGSFFSHS